MNAINVGSKGENGSRYGKRGQGLDSHVKDLYIFQEQWRQESFKEGMTQPVLCLLILSVIMTE
jgi:hypothetical protein